MNKLDLSGEMTADAYDRIYASSGAVAANAAWVPLAPKGRSAKRAGVGPSGGIHANLPALPSVELAVPSDTEIWDLLSKVYGWTGVSLNGVGMGAAIAGCRFGGLKGCVVGAGIGKGLGAAAIGFSVASALTDCLAHGWDGLCQGGLLYTSGISLVTVAAPPGVGNFISGGLGAFWMLTTTR